MLRRRCALSMLLLLAPGAFGAPAALAAAKPPKAASGTPRTIAVDVGRVKGPHDKAFRLCVGAGRANEGLRADWQEQLAHGPARVRLPLRALPRPAARRHGRLPGDARREAGLQLAVRRRALRRHPARRHEAVRRAGLHAGRPGQRATRRSSGGGATSPRPSPTTKWEAAGRGARRATSRSATAATRSRRWYFEVWNEPNLDGFWAGHAGGLLQALRALGRAPSRASRPTTASAARPRPARPGPRSSCATARRTALPLDFVSTHSYNVDGYLDELGEQQLRARARQGRRSATTCCASPREIEASPSPGGRAALHGVELVLLLARPRARPLLLGALHPLAPQARRRRGALDVVLDLHRRVRGGRPGPDAVPRRLRPAEPAGPQEAGLLRLPVPEPPRRHGARERRRAVLGLHERGRRTDPALGPADAGPGRAEPGLLQARPARRARGRRTARRLAGSPRATTS